MPADSPASAPTARQSLTSPAQQGRGELFPEIEPFHVAKLPLDARAYDVLGASGNADGVPVIFLHGGPGAGALGATVDFSTRRPIASSSSISAAPAVRRRWAKPSTTPRRS